MEATVKNESTEEEEEKEEQEEEEEEAFPFLIRLLPGEEGSQDSSYSQPERFFFSTLLDFSYLLKGEEAGVSPNRV